MLSLKKAEKAGTCNEGLNSEHTCEPYSVRCKLEYLTKMEYNVTMQYKNAQNNSTLMFPGLYEGVSSCKLKTLNIITYLHN
jgi:hypothetical protein